MTYVPPDALATMPSRNPKVGGTGKIDSAAAYVQEIAEDASRFEVLVRGAQRGFDVVTSKAVDKIDAKLGESLIPGAQTLQRSASAAKTAFNAYAAEVSRINAAADRALAKADLALGAIRTHSATIEEISRKIRWNPVYSWKEAPSAALPDPTLGSRARDLTAAQAEGMVGALRVAYEYQWFVAASLWREALGRIDSAVMTWATLFSDRVEAEKQLVRALSQTDIGQLISIHGGVKRMPPYTIANAVSGELWGEKAADAKLAKNHPLLKDLIGPMPGEHVFDSPPDPEVVAKNWAKLDDAERERLINEVPWVIGNLPGLPFVVRDQANRMLLDYYIVHSEQMGAVCNTALDDVLLTLSKDDGEPSISIVALNFEGRVPMVAMGYGGLDVAKNVSWVVPGMLSDAHEAYPGLGIASKNLYAEQLRVLRAAGRGEEGNAIVAFMEYDTPDGSNVLAAGSAREGATRLSAELDGTTATRNLNMVLPNQAVLGHSYGTTTAANALTQVNHSVQSFTMIASAGLDGKYVKSLTDLKVDQNGDNVRKIYTTLADADSIAPIGSNLSGRKTPNPEGTGRLELLIDGAYTFSSDGTGALKATDSHDPTNDRGQGYFDLGTQSLWNAAATSMGDVDSVRGPFAVFDKSSVETDMASRYHVEFGPYVK